MVVTVTLDAETYAVFHIVGSATREAFIKWTMRMCELPRIYELHMQFVDAITELEQGGYTVTFTHGGE